jgi:DNA-binding transcriptional LysR family regulator
VPAENDLRVGLAVFCRQFSVLAHDRRLRTFSIGSCSPFPVMELMPSLQQFFAEKTILTELVDTDAHLLTRLKNRGYDLVILHSLPTDKALYCQRYMDEQIYLTVEENHPVANKKSISFAEMLVVCRASNQSKYRAIFNAVRGYALRH